MVAGRTVLFVGRRARGFAAARRLGLEIVYLDEIRPPRKTESEVDRFLRCDFGGGPASWQAVAATLAAERRIDAVFAMTARAVRPAAELRHHLGVPGTSREAARRVTDKLEMKAALAAAGVRCARTVDASEGLDGEALADRLGLPLVLKGRESSAGRQTQIITERRDLPRRLRAGWMAESFIAGEEMSVEALVADGKPVFTSPTEYLVPRWANIIPAPLADERRRAVRELLAGAVAALDIRCGFLHLELFLTPDGGAAFCDIAARPPGGHIVDLMELVYPFDVWEAWIRLGLGASLDADLQPRRTAGVWLLHPGEGIVREIRGQDELRRLPGLHSVQLRVFPGRRVAHRVGSGQDVGHIIVTGDGRDEVAERLHRAAATLEILVEPPPPPPVSRDGRGGARPP